MPAGSTLGIADARRGKKTAPNLPKPLHFIFYPSIEKHRITHYFEVLGYYHGQLYR